MKSSNDDRERLDQLTDELLRAVEGVATGVVDVVEFDRLTDQVRKLASKEAEDELWETTLSPTEVVGTNIRGLRKGARWTQSKLATSMADLGFGWNQVTVAQVEGGVRRRATFEELFGLAGLFARPVAEFLIPLNHGLDVSEALEISGRDAAELVLGRGGRLGTGGAGWRAAARASALAGARPAHELGSYDERNR